MQSTRENYSEINHLLECIQRVGTRPLNWRRNIRLVPTDADKVDNALWGAHYRRDIGPLLDDTHTKAQYAAAWLEKRAENARPDLAQLYYRQFMQFLMQYQETSWACYRIAKLICQGKGTNVDKEEAIEIIIKSIQKGDYRGGYLFLARDTPSLQPGDLTKLPMSIRQKLIVLCNEGYQQNCGRAATILGYLSEIIGRNADAEKWYSAALQTVRPDVEAIHYLRHFYEIHYGLDIDEYLIGKWSEILRKVPQLPTCLPVIGGVFNQISYHHTNLGEPDKARESLARAAQCGNAEAINDLFQLDVEAWRDASYQEQFAPVYRDLLKACHNHRDVAVEYVARCINDEGIEVVKGKLIQQFTQGYHALAFGVCVALLRGTDEEKQAKFVTLAEDAEYMWWLQIAAQYTPNRDYDQFHHFANARNKAQTLPVYCACVIGFNFLLGITGTTQSDMNAEAIRRATHYFEMAIEKDEEAVIKYLATGKKQGFLTEELVQVLEENVMALRPVLDAVNKPENPKKRRAGRSS